MSPKSVLLLLICSCIVLGLTNATSLDQIGARNWHHHTYDEAVPMPIGFARFLGSVGSWQWQPKPKPGINCQ